MGFLTRCKRPFLFAFLLQFCNMFFSFFLKTFLILFEKQQYAVYGLRDNIAPAASEQSDEAASDTGSKSVLGGQGHES